MYCTYLIVLFNVFVSYFFPKAVVWCEISDFGFAFYLYCLCQVRIEYFKM